MQDVSPKLRSLQLVLMVTALLCGVLLIVSSVQSVNSPFRTLSPNEFLQAQLNLLVQLRWLIGALFIMLGIMFAPRRIPSPPKFSGEKDLSHDSYKLYLVKKYGIEKNSVLDQLTCQEKIFPNVAEALLFAHQLESPDPYIDRPTATPASQNLPEAKGDISLIKPIEGVVSGQEFSNVLNSHATASPIQNHHRLTFLLGVSLFTVVLGGLYYANKQSPKEPATLPVAPVAEINTDQVVTHSIPPVPSPSAEVPGDASVKPASTPINERWIGLWVADGNKQKLSITPLNFKYGSDDFTWVGLRPKGVIQCCPAFYEGSTSKADLLERIQQQATSAGVKADQQKTVETVKALSEGNFKKIVIADPFLRKYFFIYDQNFVYRINRDLGDNADLVVEQFKKQE